MYVFNENNIVTGYIKELLHSFNLPKAKVWTEGMRVYVNNYYIIKGQLAKALYSGVFTSTDISNTSKKIFNKISPYYYGQKFTNITKNLKLNNLTYDSYTHKYLGNYLRFYRDYKGIDLMPLYNCFSNEQPNSIFNVSINLTNTFLPKSKSSFMVSFNASNELYKIYMVPVKFNKQYTIAIDCDLGVECFCGLYSIHHITDNDLDTTASDNNIAALENNTYQKISSCSFNRPFVYNKLKDLIIANDIYNREDNLKLFIKIPVSNKSSIVVLEGDYTDDTNIMPDGTLHLATPLYTKYLNDTYINTNTRKIGTTKLQLLQVNSGVQHPFSNRLVEYLLNNVITSDEEIGDNIKRVQQKGYKGIDVNGTIRKLVVTDYGVWDDNIKEYLYNIAADKIMQGSKNNNNAKTFLDLHTDILGYVDKDIEQLINSKGE